MEKKISENSEMTLAEAAERIGVSKRRVRQIVADGRLSLVRTVKLGALAVHMLNREQVEKFAKLSRPRGNLSGKPRTGKARKKGGEK